MKQYHVSWEIELDAKNPRDAAKKALEIHRDQNSLATVFTVTDEKGNQKKVDLSE